jgi:hypothetical protein
VAQPVITLSRIHDRNDYHQRIPFFNACALDQAQSADFLKLVIMAIAISTPCLGYLMNRWLAGFAYRVDISFGIFALASLVAIGIAALTVSFQSIKAGLINPVKSLRSESISYVSEKRTHLKSNTTKSARACARFLINGESCQ